MRDYFLTHEKDAVLGVFTVSGFSFAARGQASGLVLHPHEGLARSARQKEPRASGGRAGQRGTSAR